MEERIVQECEGARVRDSTNPATPVAPSPPLTLAQPSTELRSERVQEIMGHVPTWTIRYGITVIFGALVLVLLLAWMVRYPDVVTAPGTLTSMDPPRDAVARSEGKLVRIEVAEGDTVAAGDPLAVIESTADPLAMDSLAALLPVLQQALVSGAEQFPALGSLDVGEGRTELATLRTALAELQAWRTDGYRAQRNAGLREKIATYGKLIGSTQNQLRWTYKKQANYLAEAKVDSLLAHKGVIATTELRQKQNAFLDQQVGVANMEHGLQQYRLALLETETQLNDALHADENRQRELEEAYRGSMERLRAFLESWRLSHTLSAPVAGRVYFAGRLTLKQSVKSGDVLFSVDPLVANYVFEAAVPSAGSGKVHLGQQAYIQLEGFPSDEFGKLIGTVRSMTSMPHEGSYRVVIDLPEGLRTSFHRTLKYHPEMKGSVEVVARERSVLGRIFDKVRGAVER